MTYRYIYEPVNCYDRASETMMLLVCNLDKIKHSRKRRALLWPIRSKKYHNISGFGDCCRGRGVWLLLHALYCCRCYLELNRNVAHDQCSFFHLNLYFLLMLSALPQVTPGWLSLKVHLSLRSSQPESDDSLLDSPKIRFLQLDHLMAKTADIPASQLMIR